MHLHWYFAAPRRTHVPVTPPSLLALLALQHTRDAHPAAGTRADHSLPLAGPAASALGTRAGWPLGSLTQSMKARSLFGRPLPK